MTQLIIAPRTKVAELIDAYPQLEGVLVEHVPAFEKLRNPLLRRTVARVTTLQQAATIGGVRVEDLINHLRKEVGKDALYGSERAAPGGEYVLERPSWFSKEAIVTEFDARGMLAEGEQPVHQVIADLQALCQGDIYKLVAPFLPAPLVDKASSLGISHWVAPQEGQDAVVFFCRE